MINLKGKELALDLYKCKDSNLICVALYDTNTNERTNSGYAANIIAALRQLANNMENGECKCKTKS